MSCIIDKVSLPDHTGIIKDRHDTTDLCKFMCMYWGYEPRDLAVPKKPYITNHENIQAESQTSPLFRSSESDFHKNMIALYLTVR